MNNTVHSYRLPYHERLRSDICGEKGDDITILVIDVGTSTLRAAAVRSDGTVAHTERRSLALHKPTQGLVEFDPVGLWESALEAACAVIEHAGAIEAVGITNQRASTVAWSSGSGRPIGPGIGWQDLRTAGECLALQADGLRLSPNQSATKLAHLVGLAGPEMLSEVLFGTVDTWLAWQLSQGELHVTDRSNAAVTGLFELDGSGWSSSVVAALGLDPSMLPRLVPTSGVIGEASALPGSPPIAALIGDQQASLIGQSCVRPGQTKITFGTGGMLDVCVGPTRPTFDQKGAAGCFPIIAWEREGHITWGSEAMMLAAGSAVEWLHRDLDLIASPSESEQVAASTPDTGGVWFVPALVGLGAPHWDFGAQATLFGLSPGADRSCVVRAVLEGVAHRGADLVEAAEADTGYAIETLRIDGGMSGNTLFVQALANACGLPIEVSALPDATMIGAAYMAGIAVGVWAGEDDIAAMWRPRAAIEPTATTDRDRWREAVARTRDWIPELSALSF